MYNVAHMCFEARRTPTDAGSQQEKSNLQVPATIRAFSPGAYSPGSLPSRPTHYP